MQIQKYRLQPAEIPFLQNSHTLYTCDFRAIGESMTYEIPAMWKYENLLAWIAGEGFVVVNAHAEKISFRPSQSTPVPVPFGEKAQISLYQRLESAALKNVQALWVAVPHPDADHMAKQHSLKLNYSYKDFLQYNDKFAQKKLFGDQTPEWQKCETLQDVEAFFKKYPSGYVKRRYGSGGFTIFQGAETVKDEKFLELFQAAPQDWYTEVEVRGTAHSIQVASFPDQNTVVVFGYSVQNIVEGKYFCGSDIQSLDDLNGELWTQIQTLLQKLEPITREYEGFFGVDFMIQEDDRVSALEVNVRLTAATVPTLLTNAAGVKHARYREDDADRSGDAANVITLTMDSSNGLPDTLELLPLSGSVGTALSFSLEGVSHLPDSLSSADIQKIESIVERYVSDVAAHHVYNFWPFGWTVSFILFESHCVISSWHLEKRLLFDIFCCADNFRPADAVQAFSDYFQATSSKDVIFMKR